MWFILQKLGGRFPDSGAILEIGLKVGVIPLNATPPQV